VQKQARQYPARGWCSGVRAGGLGANSSVPKAVSLAALPDCVPTGATSPHQLLLQLQQGTRRGYNMTPEVKLPETIRSCLQAPGCHAK